MAIRLPIETERLVIRPLRLDDAEALHELYSNAEATRSLAWAVVERESGRVIGGAELLGKGRDANLDCRIVPGYRRRGFGLEASRAILRAAFASGSKRISAETDTGNAAAASLLTTLGFLPCGETTRDGRATSLYVCELLHHHGGPAAAA